MITKWVVGVDEAGRGPLAGPITVAVFVAPQNLRSKLIKTLGSQIKDSKKFSPNQRYTIYRTFIKLRKERQIFFFVSHVSNKIIDKRGISYATRLGIKRTLNQSKAYTKRSALAKLWRDRSASSIKLDGLLKAPEEYKNQKTIIGGDGKDIFIACASIVAKVRRDRLMFTLAKKYPKYCLDFHKGYGTLLHRKLIKKHGLSDLHRSTFCKNFKI